LIQAGSYREKPPIGNAHLKFEFMALNEVVCVLVGVDHLRHAPMIGAAIFELDLAFLDPRLLNLEFGEGRLCSEENQPRGRATG
jgi:hypothetical protein